MNIYHDLLLALPWVYLWMSVNLCKAKNRQVKESLVNVLVMVNSLYRIYFFRSIEQFHLFLMMLPGDGKGTLLFPSYR